MFNINNIVLNTAEAQAILDRTATCVDYVDMAAELTDYGVIWDGDAAELVAKAWSTLHPSYAFGVCSGRHEMPVSEYVFGENLDPTKRVEMYDEAYRRIPADAAHVDLYITGLTPATLAVVAVCADRGITLTAYNYDRNTGKYLPQRVL